jgi:hypothetical protein
MDVKPVDLVKRSRAFLHDVLHETHAAILTLASGPFHKGSLFAKTLGSTLTADQLAAYEQQQSKGSAASDTIPSPAAKSEK